MEKIRQFFAQKLNLGSASNESLKVLETVDFDGVMKYIRDGCCKSVVTMAGAGMSTSAGIPDFRSPGSGLYDNLGKYDLPRPEAVFDISFFEKNPQPFFDLARQLYPSELKPTICHRFIRLLEQKGLLLRHYTQNIDTLERAAGVSDERIVEAHGTFHTSHCTGCRQRYDQQWMKDQIFSEDVPKCESCGAVVKPDIVFFGENLPSRFFRLVQDDLKKCDLLIIFGTSLAVQPFASLVDRVPDTCPRLLVNKEKCGRPNLLMRMMGQSGLEFDSSSNYRDVAWLGTCDDGAVAMAAALGWQEELRRLQGEDGARPEEAA
ncbi:NAD-dependent protein deacetylase sirtuin-2-like isoform X2 [Pollicipes pollicipes]|nr:NAD-dependent protein deacetylase sirtuin-2-like isoform X2 [Pollicipes pollicipes]XP_037093551.1 NAD-dependent protein deacetylase sirtuin-2-like isoform X2 [Pollicipes pollicipes]XP_037093555.1 NAD-dependent protein deacetylase sirtuin-2-like isoform X2 [Pollicipes pollicipes]XP_037093562.1 NAD-dependent protein deacetylase sirtuin-2-like isoform X2 [Pollicipes pollicipes]XP_037093571.1 NAD-dependent protein deacetylase sirtuin-2-like isoform X2 [Pollicipes pollicipes]